MNTKSLNTEDAEVILKLTPREEKILLKLGTFFLSQDKNHVINYAIFRIVDDDKKELLDIYNTLLQRDKQLKTKSKCTTPRNKVTGRFERK